MQRSPSYRDGEFHNSMEQMTVSWLQITKAELTNDAAYVEPETPPSVSSPDFETPVPPGLRVTWLGHSSMVLEIDGARFLTDPVFGPRSSPSPYFGPKRFHPAPVTVADLPPLDAVLISHDHYDHLDEPTIRELAGLDVPFYAPLGVGAHLEYWGVPAARVHELDWWETSRVAGIDLHCTPARHASGRTGLDMNRTFWAGWAVVGEHHRAYFSGDTGMFDGIAEIGRRYGPFDLTMLEVGAYGTQWPDWHLGPEQAVRAHQLAGGRVFLPVHWGTFNLALHNWTEPLERVRVAAEAADVIYLSPQPGETVDVNNPSPPRQWWPDRPWRTEAEAPVVSTGLNRSSR